ncbi:MAG TPA: glycoside hydrolase family 65 protein, partial [Anaerolineales bacterium]|nr:glycoside hydrolase family 65 protein [Anaerolineales bacterium]
MHDLWTITESQFDPLRQQHSETVFTLGNGYLGTRGAFEEFYPGEERTTFVHGIFDDIPIVFTELVNFPDWLELEIILSGERFNLAEGEILDFNRQLNLFTGLLTRTVRWRSPKGKTTRLEFRRFASLADEHLACLQVLIIPEDYSGSLALRSGLDAATNNQGYRHWDWLDQGLAGNTCWLKLRTKTTAIEAGNAARLTLFADGIVTTHAWDVHGHPTLACETSLRAGQAVRLEKFVSIYTSRDRPDPLASARAALAGLPASAWDELWQAHTRKWEEEWRRCDVIIEGDAEAQLAIRFNLYHLLIAAPRSDERVNIGAKTLSGHGYRGHAFWDTEIFMLPFFTFTRPQIARSLLSYRFHNLPGAVEKAASGGFSGAQYPWESAGDGLEVTPTWFPNPEDRANLIRIWTGDIELHISADIAFAVWQYWLVSQDHEFLSQRGAEIILETARFWVSRLEWDSERGLYEITDVIGPDEYHEHVDNNAYTNYLVRWHLRKAVWLAGWLVDYYSPAARVLFGRLGMDEETFSRWRQIAEQIYCPTPASSGLIEQFDGYFERTDLSLASLEPRSSSVQSLLGIEGTNETQLLKQPDVVMLMYLLPEEFDAAAAQANFDYYTARTDLTYGSSLGPSIQAILATRHGSLDSAYENFLRAARADLEDVRGNAADGIHGASAGGLWQAVVFGFAG